METSGEDDGTALLVTANGLVPMPKIDLEFGSRRDDQVKFILFFLIGHNKFTATKKGLISIFLTAACCTRKGFYTHTPQNLDPKNANLVENANLVQSLANSA